MKKLFLLLLLVLPLQAAALGTTSGSGSGTANATLPLQRPATTVAALPSCGAPLRGVMYVVTNALSPTALATVAGGGAVVVGVMCDGTNWIVN